MTSGNQSITIGYHRLYSHRAFRASFGVRVVLAAMGSSAFQGSIKVSFSISLWYFLTHA
jgi:fatty-acid desaturase